jgi:hypothetical protein
MLVPSREGAIGDQHLAQVLGRSSPWVGVEGFVGEGELVGSHVGEHRRPLPAPQPVQGAVGLARSAEGLVDGHEALAHEAGRPGEQLPRPFCQGAAGTAAVLVEAFLHPAVPAAGKRRHPGAVAAQLRC